MPFKARSKRSSTRRRPAVSRKRSFKRRPRTSKMVMVNRMPKSMNYPLPPRYRTSVVLDQTLVITPLQDFGHFDILGNSLFGSYTSGVPQLGGPFAVTGILSPLGMTQVDSATYTTSVSTVGFSLQTWYNAIASGLNQLMPSPYNRAKVFASKVQFKVFIDGAATSPMTIACIPWKPDASGIGSLPPSLVADIASLPKGKYQQFVQNSTSKANTLSNYITSAQALGVPRKAIQLDSSYSQEWSQPLQDGISLLGNPSFAWRFAYNTAGTVAPLPFTVNVKVRYYVELYNTATGLLLSTNGSGPPPA